VSESVISYAPRTDATPEAELSALVNIYRFVLDCQAKKKAGGSDAGEDDAERDLSDSARTLIPDK
jgi:hypothetical protein